MNTSAMGGPPEPCPELERLAGIAVDEGAEVDADDGWDAVVEGVARVDEVVEVVVARAPGAGGDAVLWQHSVWVPRGNWVVSELEEVASGCPPAAIDAAPLRLNPAASIRTLVVSDAAIQRPTTITGWSPVSPPASAWRARGLRRS